MVSSSGLSRLPPGRVQGEQPGGREEFVWPAYPVFLAVAATGSFLLLAQHRPKPPSRERVDVLETRGRVLEVVVPPFEHRIERGDHAGEALSARPSRLRSDLVPQAQHALLPHEPASRLEAISQELEPLPDDPAIPDMSLVRMQGQAVRVHERTDQREGLSRLLRAVAQDDEVVGVANHRQAVLGHQHVERMQIEIRQQRADDRALRRASRGGPSRAFRYDVLFQPALDQLEKAAIADPRPQPLHQPVVRDRVEVALQIGVHHEAVARFDQPVDLPQRILAAAPRPEAEAPCMEMRLQDGSSTNLTAVWAMRSLTVGIPNGRTPPSPFGISTRRIADGRYSPVRSSRDSSAK